MKEFKSSHKKALAVVVLCVCTVLILFTGPSFNFGLQVVLSFILMFFLIWLVT